MTDMTLPVETPLGAPVRKVMTLEDLRLRNMRILCAFNWLALPSVVGTLLRLQTESNFALIATIILNIPCTWMLIQRRQDRVARLAFTFSTICHPFLMSYLVMGTPLQDGCVIYYLVALASLTLLCDWVPIAIGAVLICVNHLVVSLYLPSLGYGDATSLPTLVNELITLGTQSAFLCYITHRMQRLFSGQASAEVESRRLADEAVAERKAAGVERENAINALSLAKTAEAREAEERHKRQKLEQDLSQRQRAELLNLAKGFEQSVTSVVLAVQAASRQLEDSANSLTSLASDTGREAVDVAAGAAQASSAVRQVAGAVTALNASIAEVAVNVEQQSRLSVVARSNTSDSDATVRGLSDRTEAIGDFVGTIQMIASRTNLLALNATIEAARAGDAGRSFAVVAGEVKQLAGQTSHATKEISGLMEAFNVGVASVADNLDQAGDAVREVAEVAGTIKNAVDLQRASAQSIQRNVEHAARGADMIEQRMESVARAASAAGSLSTQVSAAASELSRTAETLRLSTDSFVEHLRGADGDGEWDNSAASAPLRAISGRR